MFFFLASTELRHTPLLHYSTYIHIKDRFICTRMTLFIAYSHRKTNIFIIASNKR